MACSASAYEPKENASFALHMITGPSIAATHPHRQTTHLAHLQASHQVAMANLNLGAPSTQPEEDSCVIPSTLAVEQDLRD